jgi:hypothetical protein
LELQVIYRIINNGAGAGISFPTVWVIPNGIELLNIKKKKQLCSRKFFEAGQIKWKLSRSPITYCM